MAARQRRVHNEQVPPPPPPAPTVQELMAQQNEILRQLLQRQPHPQQHGGGQQQRPPAAATYQEFLSTQPPLFTKAEDLLDADVWLRVVDPSFPSSRETALMIPRPASPCSSFVALLGLGGTTFVLCYPLIMKCLGRNSRLLSEGTTSQLEFLIAS
jgi:hypothetical protein